MGEDDPRTRGNAAARHARIGELFKEARRLAPEARKEFLAQACTGDDELRRQVDSLLAHGDAPRVDIDATGARQALAREATALLARGAAKGAEGLGAGSPVVAPAAPRSVRYPIEGEIGRGGMGVVYRARDTKLERPVAIKMLPPEFARDARHLERFECEARILASLNHPSIATVHDLDEVDGAGLLVLELIEGETLAERIGRGPLPVSEALAAGVQIAGALEAAHARGVIHRDLKPENIMLTPDGLLKVLDFGLAKRVLAAVSPAAPAAASCRPQTATAALLGTPGYMSPEQARGEPLDRRADVWAFGCVLYSALTGREAFAGRTVLARLQATLEREPDWKGLAASAPADVVELVERCLQKDLQRRFDDIGEARRVLERELARLSDAGPARKERRHNLPRQFTSFVGREREKADVKQLLTTASLATVTGVGGCGKSRLALQVAGEVGSGFEHGLFWVDLASLAEPALVPRALASVLELREERGHPLTQTLVDYLEQKTMLVVLDNCEHLLGACSELVDALRQACPGLRFLATSREALGVSGERTYLLPRLATPGVEPVGAVDDLLGFDAVELFVERATRARPDFRLGEENAAAVVHLCRRLDGLPLALELAAARARVLSVEQIADRLADSLRLLTGGARTALARHQTLRATLDWSHDLLSARERTLFRRLSVFVGALTLDAAESVCRGDGIERDDVFDDLTHLVDKSLVEVMRAAGAVRYRFLETVRQYAGERLAEAGESDAVRDRHRDYFVELAETAESDFGGPKQAVWLARLEADHYNFRAVLDRCQAQPGGAEPTLRLAGALAEFWNVHGHHREARERLEGALERAGDTAPAALRARALRGLGWLALSAGDPARARSYHELALALFRAIGDKAGAARSLSCLAAVAREQGDLRASQALVEECLALSRELGDNRGVAHALCNLGNIALDRGDSVAARELYEQSLPLLRGVGDQVVFAGTLTNLGRVAHFEGDLSAARGLYEEALALHRELGNRKFEAHTINNLGCVALRQGEPGAARALHEECLSIYREIGEELDASAAVANLGNVAFHEGDLRVARSLYREYLEVVRGMGFKGQSARALDTLACIAATAGESRRAALLFGASAMLLAMTGGALDAEASELHDRWLPAARAALGEEAFAAACEEGGKLSVEEAAQLA